MIACPFCNQVHFAIKSPQKQLQNVWLRNHYCYKDTGTPSGFGGVCWEAQERDCPVAQSNPSWKTKLSALSPAPLHFLFLPLPDTHTKKRRLRTQERRGVPILTLQHCPCRPKSLIPGGLGSSPGVVFTGFGGLHQQRFLFFVGFLRHAFTLLIPRSCTGN